MESFIKLNSKENSKWEKKEQMEHIGKTRKVIGLF